MTPEQAAMVATTERRIAERFEQLAIPEPQESAHRLIEDLLRAGWRPWPQLIDTAGPRRRAAAEAREEAMREIRSVLSRDRSQS